MASSKKDVAGTATTSINGQHTLSQKGPANLSRDVLKIDAIAEEDDIMNEEYRTGDSPHDSDYKSEESPVLDDLEDDFFLDNDNHVTGNWKHGVTASGLFSSSSAAWPLAEGNLRNSNGGDDFEETETSIERKSENTNTGEKSIEENEEDKTKFKFSTLTRSQKVILVATSITNLLSFLSLSILAPFYPIEADKKNVSGTISGWIFGVFALVQFLTSPLFGKLLPIVGSKFMYVAGLFVTCVCTFLFGILDMVPFQDGVTLYVSFCFLVRIMLALGCTALSNAGFVMLVKAFPDNVATVFGIGEIFTGIGMVAGPAMGGFLYAAGGFVLPFIVIGGSCLIALPIIWLTIPYQDDTTNDDGEDLPMRTLALNTKSMVNSFVIVIAAAIWAILDPTLEPHLRVYGFGPEIVGILFLIMAACYSVTSPLWGTLADRMPDNRALLIPGFVLAAVGLLLLGPSPALGFALSFNELWLTILSLVILGIASSLVVIPTYDIYIDILGDIGYPEDTRTYGMVSGLWVSMYALGDFVGPSLGGFLNDEVGFEWMATGVAGVCLGTGLLIIVTWFIEVKCCKTKYTEEGVGSERTPLLASSSTHLASSSMDTDILKTYPPHKQANMITSGV